MNRVAVVTAALAVIVSVYAVAYPQTVQVFLDIDASALDLSTDAGKATLQNALVDQFKDLKEPLTTADVAYLTTPTSETIQTSDHCVCPSLNEKEDGCSFSCAPTEGPTLKPTTAPTKAPTKAPTTADQVTCKCNERCPWHKIFDGRPGNPPENEDPGYIVVDTVKCDEELAGRMADWNRNHTKSGVWSESQAGCMLTRSPTMQPTKAPTFSPTLTKYTLLELKYFMPSKPTPTPTYAPTSTPTYAPTPAPTTAPTPPTNMPTANPTKYPTEAPTPAPTAAPTKAPTAAPTKAPTGHPAWKTRARPCMGRRWRTWWLYIWPARSHSLPDISPH